MMEERRYGWRPDVPDARDLRLAAPRRKKLPRKVDMRWLCSEVEDQGYTMSCVGHGVAGALELLDRKGDGKHTDVSRLYLYYNAREIDGMTRYDCGTYIRSAVKAAGKSGVCREETWPFSEESITRTPTGAAYAEGSKHKITGYYRADGLNAVRYALSEGLPVVFGFTVYESFDGEETRTTGRMVMPKRDESAFGGHCVLAVGYDDDARTVTCRNSYGEKWGDKGYFYMPYEYIDSRDLSDDFWVISMGGYGSLEVKMDGRDIKWYVPIVSVFDWLYKKFRRKEK